MTTRTGRLTLNNWQSRNDDNLDFDLFGSVGVSQCVVRVFITQRRRTATSYDKCTKSSDHYNTYTAVYVAQCSSDQFQFLLFEMCQAHSTTFRYEVLTDCSPSLTSARPSTQRNAYRKTADLVFRGERQL